MQHNISLYDKTSTQGKFKKMFSVNGCAVE